MGHNVAAESCVDILGNDEVIAVNQAPYAGNAGDVIGAAPFSTWCVLLFEYVRRHHGHRVTG